jgi:hypothetical protein
VRTGAILLGGAMLLLSSTAAAQQAAPSPPPPASEPPPAPRPVAPVYRNGTMRTAGIVLTGIGVALAVAGGAALGWGLAQTGGLGLNGIGGDLVGSFFLGGSAVIAAIGVPLWVIGAKPPQPEAAAAIPAWAVPAVGAGPRSVTLRWSF